MKGHMLPLRFQKVFQHGKVKQNVICIAFTGSRNNLASKALRYDTRYTRVHTVLSATKYEPYLPLLPSRRASPPFGQYSLRPPTEEQHK